MPDLSIVLLLQLFLISPDADDSDFDGEWEVSAAAAAADPDADLRAYDGVHARTARRAARTVDPRIADFRERRARELAGRYHWYAGGRTYLKRPTVEPDRRPPTQSVGCRANEEGGAGGSGSGSVEGGGGGNKYSGDTGKVRKRPGNKK